jgi:hypothetical protein
MHPMYHPQQLPIRTCVVDECQHASCVSWAVPVRPEMRDRSNLSGRKC